MSNRTIHYRAPALNVKPASNGSRAATLHYHGSTKAEESEDIYYAPSHYEIGVTRSMLDCQPVMKIRQPDHFPGCPDGCNVAHPAPLLRIQCDEETALLALATITVEHEPESDEIDGNFDDAETRTRVRDQLSRGNEWAWCSVTVRARWAGFEGRDYLGACSYRGEYDFRRPGGYFDDMVRTAVKELASAIERGAAMLRDHCQGSHAILSTEND